MHASMAYLNGVGRGPSGLDDNLVMLDTLLVAAGQEKTGGDGAKSKDEHQAELESEEETVSKPGGYRNDPDDATNPNEVRERHLKKVNR